LKQEMAGSARLGYKSKVLGYHLDEIESMYEAEARKRELRITKLYARFNNDIAKRIRAAEGNLEVI
jgi:endo-alpha-1,4-polygalactosaminidase (GH114 family)